MTVHTGLHLWTWDPFLASVASAGVFGCPGRTQQATLSQSGRSIRTFQILKRLQLRPACQHKC